MARLQISVLSCYPTVTVRGKANVTVCAFFGFSQLGGLGPQVGQITITLTFLVGVGPLKCLHQGASDLVTPLELPDGTRHRRPRWFFVIIDTFQAESL